MANTELVRLAPDAPMELVIRAINSLTDVFLGNDGGRVLMVGHDGTSTDPNLGTNTGTGLYQTVIRSSGTNHLQVRNSANTTDMLTVTDTTANAQALTVATTSAFTGLATFNGGATIATGALTANGNVTLGDAAADTLTVNATTTFASPVTGNGTLQFKPPLTAVCTVALPLTTTPTNITGCTLSLTPGVWLVTGVFDFSNTGAGDVGSALVGALAVTGGAATVATATAVALLIMPTINARLTVAQTWLVTVTATTTATLQGSKNAGTGTSTVQTTGTTLTATNA